MVKFLKKGKVVILTNGRFAGRKAVICHTNDNTNKRPYPHAIVAGIDRYPLKVTNTMSKKKVYRRSRLKPFVKTVNYTHILPTRYTFEGDLPNLDVKDPAAKTKVRKAVRRVFQKKLAEGKQKWFFAKLRF
eukprot:TRINITY_DN1151_c0_g1_i1.p1 TRINITY_DN1151_c0_g1~~TRINITY_DN1151_c0_g1_i1.p1  ORF type:complete len:131 (-),score=5.35 TRINITY_DN1151_c0_g1_i1:183-575(-)